MNKDAAIRVVMMPRDANHLGNIFGGVILSYIDQAGFVEATRHAYHEYVTVSVDRVDFKNPVMVGDIVGFYTKVVKVGTTSIKIQVDVYSEQLDPSATSIHVTQAELTYVTLDRNKRPTPILAGEKNLEGKA